MKRNSEHLNNGLQELRDITLEFLQYIRLHPLAFLKDLVPPKTEEPKLDPKKEAERQQLEKLKNQVQTILRQDPCFHQCQRIIEDDEVDRLVEEIASDLVGFKPWFAKTFYKVRRLLPVIEDHDLRFDEAGNLLIPESIERRLTWDNTLIRVEDTTKTYASRLLEISVRFNGGTPEYRIEFGPIIGSELYTASSLEILRNMLKVVRGKVKRNLRSRA